MTSATAPGPTAGGPVGVEFFFDPVCPFAWVTSRWVERVVALRGLDVSWRFISLRMVNEGRDYEAEFPPGYLAGHTRGLRMLRIAAAVRAAAPDPAAADDAVGRLYTSFGTALWHEGPRAESGIAVLTKLGGEVDVLRGLLERVGLDPGLADAADDERHDRVVRADTDEALRRTGGGIGTPVVTYDPPGGPSFFGPVISHVPDDTEAVRLWEAVTTLATFPGFAELKRSLRDPLDLPVLRRG